MKIYHYLLAYIVSIFLFGTYYWGHYYFHPDSFIIDIQFNLHPFSSEAILNGQINTLDYYQKKSDSLRIAYNDDKISLKKYQIYSDSLQRIENEISNKFEKIQWKNVDKWKALQIPDSLKMKLLAFEEAIKKTTNESVLAELNLERLKIEQKIVEINVKSSTFILGNLTYFQDSTLSKQLKMLDSSYSNYKYKLIPEKENYLQREINELEQLKYIAHDSFSRQISFLDFLLFSASNSSTVTYGEIIPNDTSVRVALFFQAMFCITLIAFATDALINRSSKGIK